MNCLECRELLHRRLDGEAIAVETIEHHLSVCAICREQHAGALLLLDSLKKAPEARLPASFTQTMVAQVMRDRSHRQDRMRRRVYATMALAASVLLLLFLAYYWMPRPETQDPGAKDKVAKEEPKKLPPREEKLEPTPKKDAPPNILPDRLTGTMRDHARVVLAAANLENVDRLPVGVPPAAPGAREAGEVSVGVEAVTRSTRKAFDFFARELPMPDMGEQKN